MDVNVTPDKRHVFVQNERFLLAVLKASLLKLYQAESYKIETSVATLQKHAKTLRSVSEEVKTSSAESALRKFVLSGSKRPLHQLQSSTAAEEAEEQPQKQRRIESFFVENNEPGSGDLLKNKLLCTDVTNCDNTTENPAMTFAISRPEPGMVECDQHKNKSETLCILAESGEEEGNVVKQKVQYVVKFDQSLCTEQNHGDGTVSQEKTLSAGECTSAKNGNLFNMSECGDSSSMIVHDESKSYLNSSEGAGDCPVPENEQADESTDSDNISTRDLCRAEHFGRTKQVTNLGKQANIAVPLLKDSQANSDRTSALTKFRSVFDKNVNDESEKKNAGSIIKTTARMDRPPCDSPNEDKDYACNSKFSDMFVKSDVSADDYKADSPGKMNNENEQCTSEVEMSPDQGSSKPDYSDIITDSIHDVLQHRRSSVAGFFLPFQLT